MRRDHAAQKFLAKQPAAQAAFALAARGDGIAVRAAANGNPTEILIYDEIGFWGITGKDFVKALAEAGTGAVRVRINSPGGDVFDGMAIHNAIKQRGGVEVVIDGIAASAASYIAIAGERVLIHEAAMMMVHKAWGLTIGNDEDHLETAVTLGKIDSQLASLYAAKTGAEIEAMAALMAAETWFTSDEALAAKLVDDVVKAEAPKARAAVTFNASADEIERRRRMLRLAEAA